MKNSEKYSLIERELARLLEKEEDDLLTHEILKEIVGIVMRESLGSANTTTVIQDIRDTYYKIYG